MTPPKKDNRIVAIVLAIIAVGGLGYAAMSKKWLYNPNTTFGVEVGFGPRGNFVCADSQDSSSCETMTTGARWRRGRDMLGEAGADPKRAQNTTMPARRARPARETLPAPAAFSPFGWITFVVILIAALSLAI